MHFLFLTDHIASQQETHKETSNPTHKKMEALALNERRACWRSDSVSSVEAHPLAEKGLSCLLVQPAPQWRGRHADQACSLSRARRLQVGFKQVVSRKRPGVPQALWDSHQSVTCVSARADTAAYHLMHPIQPSQTA